MAQAPDQFEDLRLAVFEEWDPIGVHTPYDDPDDRSAYWDEYDDYLPEIARRLADADETALARYLGHVRTVLMGLNPDPQVDAASAKRLVRRLRQGT